MASSLKRVMVFIDGSNFYYALKRSFSTTKIDFEKFCNFLVNSDDLIQGFPKMKSYHLNKVCSKTIKVNDISEYLRD